MACEKAKTQVKLSEWIASIQLMVHGKQNISHPTVYLKLPTKTLSCTLQTAHIGVNCWTKDCYMCDK